MVGSKMVDEQSREGEVAAALVPTSSAVCVVLTATAARRLESWPRAVNFEV